MLIETIISVMLFTFLIAGVTMMISSATSGLRATRREAGDVQETANMMVSAPQSPQTTSVKVTLKTSTAADPNLTKKEITQNGEYISSEGLLYFYVTP